MTPNERRTAEQLRERNIATLRNYFGLLRQKNTDAWIDLWAERCVAFLPYAPEGVPRMLTGRPDVHAFHRDQIAAYREVSFGELAPLPLEDPSRVAARWFPRGRLVSGADYANEHFGIFEFDGSGRIAVATEFFDPAAATALVDASRPSRGAV
ncbi:nuclear transport factor 2 family protein [Streptomyces triticirhizae]|uniref:nuclear transport factor 2 family protein n=1 Tax=Streptomyces triticirhizae TaxID=2483353 RepID=UPI0013158711|nr:nuclear transport factor 2 family protein [Streptomyces triticirhizae]